jgi:anthranilate 1,2-dioxygenase large subunit
LNVARYKSLIFGTFAEDIMPLETYIGPTSLRQIDRIMSRPIRVLGYYRQVVEANWKLYAENTRDPYHAPLLHLFHVTFGIQTPAMKGGSYMDAEKKNNCILVTADAEDASAHDLLMDQYKTSDKYRPRYKLKDARILGTKRSFDDGITVAINTIFPSLVVAQVENAFQIRHLRPKGVEKFEIYWTYFGFDDSDAREAQDKLRLANMIGPAGFISMEDGEAARLVQQAVRTQRGQFAFIEMGGRGEVKDQDHLVQEVAIRGFWQYYRKVMQFNGDRRDDR